MIICVRKAKEKERYYRCDLSKIFYFLNIRIIVLHRLLDEKIMKNNSRLYANLYDNKKV